MCERERERVVLLIFTLQILTTDWYAVIVDNHSKE